MRFLSLLLLALPVAAHAQTVTMAESFDVGRRSRVDLRVELTGDVAVPGQTKRIAIQGVSTLTYDERVLPAEDRQNALLRVYRDVDFQRSINGERQSQDIRPAVKRMVVLRSAEGKKAPFSPDGPLTYGEIDAVRVDLFSPVLVSGLLPSKAVAPGDSWTVNRAATMDLTGLETIESGELKATYVAAVTLSGRAVERLSIVGTVRGTSEDGPTKQTIDATAYFDRKDAMLTYMSLKGIQDMLDGKDQVVGRLTGRLTLKREPSQADAVSDSIVARIDARPSEDNTRLLYDNPALGLSFVYPRHWRVGAVQGTQVTLEQTRGGVGMLITVEAPNRTPTAAQYAKEAKEFIANQKGIVRKADEPKREGDYDRFGMDIELNRQAVRMEYAVRKERDAGVTIAVRLPADAPQGTMADVAKILTSVKIKKGSS